MKRMNGYGITSVAFILVLVSTATMTRAAEEATETHRPRIGLVLGGGGARGAAHVGVIKVLEQMRIPIDVIAGTSMGAVVGGLYASGMSTEELEHELTSTDWDDVFRDAPERADRSFRRKRDDDLYTFKVKPGFNRGAVQLPLAYIRGQKFDLMLNRLTMPIIGVDDFDRLPIPFRAVASDLETGQQVVLGKGSMAKAIRASLAVPGAFDPVEIDNRLLVDGGISNNVPVSVARDMGADVLIVIDVGAGLYKRNEIKNAVDVAVQLTGFLFTLNGELQIKTLTPRDVLIRPQLGDIGGANFDRAAEAIQLGERATQEAREALAHFSMSPEEYALYRATRARPRLGPPRINFVRIDNQSRLSDEVIAERISSPSGKPFDEKRLEHEIGTIYGLDIFESVRYDVVKEAESTGLLISTKQKSWGPNYMQFGISSSNNFEGDTTMRFGALYTRTAINSLNGEWRTGVQLGDEPGIFTEVYQPLDARLRYFANGAIGYGGRNVNVFDAAGNNLARYQLTSWNLDLATGRDFGTWGEGRVGYRRESGRARIETGAPSPDIDVDKGEIYLRLSDDRLDNLYFPRTGHFGLIEWRAAREGLGSSANYDQLVLNYTHAFSWRENTLIGAISGGTTLDDDAPIDALFPLGGFLRLSGLAQDELRGQQVGLASLIYLRRLTGARLFKSYLGASAELGNVWQSSHDVSFGSAIFAGSAFLGMDTPIGPVYLAYGHDERGDQSFYIYVGPRFTF